jgi:hypothetical protein
MKVFFKRIYAAAMLLTAKTPTFWEKTCYFFKLLMACGPVVLILDSLKIWFTGNAVFISAVIGAMLINMVIGIVFHKMQGTFDWWAFIKGNSKLFFGVSVMYCLLEFLRLAAGSTIGEVLKVVVQTATMLWPVSKSLKNLYIINEKKFPPAFIMEKLYRFEKTGDIRELITSVESEENKEL